jgi:hypothetical protein
MEFAIGYLVCGLIIGIGSYIRAMSKYFKLSDAGKWHGFTVGTNKYGFFVGMIVSRLFLWPMYIVAEFLGK